jgi:hypothetical protein
MIITLPSIAPTGARNVQGTLILGIGTQANNIPTPQIKTYTTDQNGTFTTVLNGQFLPNSFIDSGSNSYVFPEIAGISTCPVAGPSPFFYCPQPSLTLAATQLSSDGKAQITLPFALSHAESLVLSGNRAFNNLGAPGDVGFIWGLPFFFGKTVFEGMSQKTSSLGTGPYWAY